MAENFVDMHVVPTYYRLLKNGAKSVEGRLNAGEALPVKEGSVLRMRTDPEEDTNILNLKVTRIAHYPTFAEFLETEGLERCLPGTKTLEDGVKVYRQFYTPEEEREHGILAFEVQVV